jgi:NAD(P)H-hydrate epimerase
MTIPLKDDDSGKLLSGAFEQLEARLSKASCVAIGPGLGKSRELQTLIHKVIRGSRSPLVIDADGLNNLADSTWQPGKAKCPLVITPHPGEWARLSGVPADDRTAQCESAIEFSQKNGVTIVLKGQHTLVTDGNTAVLNDTGTPAMSIGGSGDVLTGIITALICQGLAPRDAAHLGVHIHGLAGELAQQRLQSHVVLPTDLIVSIAEAIQKSRES